MPSLAESFVENLKFQRAKKKMSQEELGRKANLSTSYISMLERGQRSPPFGTVETIAKALGLPARSLFT
jgi:transcriptional regulator with XRE-family HTH domain